MKISKKYKSAVKSLISRHFLMKEEIHPEVSIPPEVLLEAGTDPDSKLSCEVDPENGTIRIVEADYSYDLTDLPPTLLDIFRACGVCLDDLEEKMKNEEIVYGKGD